MSNKLILSIFIIIGTLTSPAYAAYDGSDLGTACSKNSDCVTGCIDGATPYCNKAGGAGICLCKAP